MIKKYLLSIAAFLIPQLLFARVTFEGGMKLKAADKKEKAVAVFQKLVNKDPKDVKSLEQLATIEGWLGRYSDSEKHWAAAIRLDRNNFDYRMGFARVLFWDSQYDRALKQVKWAQRINSESADSWVLRGDIFMAMDDDKQAKEAYGRAEDLAPDDDSIHAKFENALPVKRWRIDAGYVYEKFSEVRDPESSAYAQLGYTWKSGTSLYSKVETLTQFKKRDNVISAGVAFSPFSRLVVMSEIGFTSSPNFKPKLQSNSELNVEIIKELALIFAYKYWSYDEKTVAPSSSPGDGTAIQIYQPGLRIQLAPWASFEGRYSLTRNLDSSQTTAYQLRLSFDTGEFLPYFGFASGTEQIPPLSKASVTYFSLGSVWNVDSEWSLRLDYTLEQRADQYSHHALGLGASYKF